MCSAKTKRLPCPAAVSTASRVSSGTILATVTAVYERKSSGFSCSGSAGTMILTIETRESLPGGRIIQPITLLVDHAGAYVGAQEIPGGGACNVADLSEPLGTLDFSDVLAFLSAFSAGDPAADLAAPTGVFDFSDVIAFLGAFGAGCP